MPPKGKKPEQKKGTFFPKDEKGERGSTFGGKQALAAALRGAGEDGTADKVAKASGGKWRFGYNNFYMSLVKAGCKSPEAALGSAEAGLEYMYSNFEHIKNEASTHSSSSRNTTTHPGRFFSRASERGVFSRASERCACVCVLLSRPPGAAACDGSVRAAPQERRPR